MRLLFIDKNFLSDVEKKTQNLQNIGNNESNDKNNMFY